MSVINNPVLKGFNPDPSILRVEKDFYIANSTFEWWPGVQISHSKDLINWQVVSRPLNRLDLLDMRGDPNSGGIWAPCLTWSNGLFYLIYTDVKRWCGAYKDCSNFLTTCASIDGEWSEPVYLNSSGFDASLFHDQDGRKWLVNMVWDHRQAHNSFAGILLQEYDQVQKKLTGPITRIFGGTTIGLVEGPHLLKKDGWYYLVAAEGGTQVTHAVTIARSKVITGPYEVMPGNPLITSAKNPELPLQSAGHGSLVELEDGSWFLAYLCRRQKTKGRAILGRETALQPVIWDKAGWPRLSSGKNLPEEVVPAPDLPAHPWPALPEKDNFDGVKLGIQYQSPRTPLTDKIFSLSARPGYLRLYGRESIQSHFTQTLIARRQQAFKVEVSTVLEMEPGDFQHMAGLVAFYSTDDFYYVFVTQGENDKKVVGLMMADRGQVSYPVEKEYPVGEWSKIYLKLTIDYSSIRFYYGSDGKAWYPVGPELDASILSDEYAVPGGFTGNFVGLACQDISGQGRSADFDWFEYREL